MAPMTRPALMMGTAPMLGRISPAIADGTAAQNGEPFAACSPSSFVGLRKLAAATAFLREVSGLKNPAPSPRMMSTVRPDSSTIEAVITVPSCLALARAAFAARSAMSSVSSIIAGLLSIQTWSIKPHTGAFRHRFPSRNLVGDVFGGGFRRERFGLNGIAGETVGDFRRIRQRVDLSVQPCNQRCRHSRRSHHGVPRSAYEPRQRLGN